MTEAETYLTSVRKRIAHLTDIEQVAALGEESHRLWEVERVIGEMRREAIRRMKLGRTASDLAAELGISRARLYKLLAE